MNMINIVEVLFFIWKVICMVPKFSNMAETGGAVGSVFTQVFLVTGKKR